VVSLIVNDFPKNLNLSLLSPINLLIFGDVIDLFDFLFQKELEELLADLELKLALEKFQELEQELIEVVVIRD